jgi:hypothetical protein
MTSLPLDPASSDTTTRSHAASDIALRDDRPFFAHALSYGLQHGMIDAATLEAIHTDAPKGIVQIARYFGSEFLRPELEKARERMVNLISLYLLDSTGSDVHQAAISLREHSLLSRSKGGSDMLKRLIAMPESSNFGMAGYADAQTPLLAVWSLRSYNDYQIELARRSHVNTLLQAARWFAQRYALDEDTLQETGADAEAVIRMGLLIAALAPKAAEWPHPKMFEKWVLALRKKMLSIPGAKSPVQLPAQMPVHLPIALQPCVQTLVSSVTADIEKLLSAKAPPLASWLRPISAFRARYLLLDDPLAEVDAYHHALDARIEADDEAAPLLQATATWNRAMQGHDDEASLLTLLVCIASASPKKTMLTENQAASLVRKIRKNGWQPEVAAQFITDHAAQAHQPDFLALWASFVQESTSTLCSDMDYQLYDALALLRRECHVVQPS